MSAQEQMNEEELFVSGHRACHGCGMAVAVRHILKATGSQVIVVTPTGCLETFTSPYGYSPWKVPWIHHLFENGPAIATGVAAALHKRDFWGCDTHREYLVAAKARIDAALADSLRYRSHEQPLYDHRSSSLSVRPQE